MCRGAAMSRGGHAHPNRHRGPDRTEVFVAVAGVVLALILTIAIPALWRL
jgi:hypothetical protein